MYLYGKRNYDTYPLKQIDGYDDHIWQGYEAIINELKEQLSDEDVLVIDLYHGVDVNEVYSQLVKPLGGKAFFCETAKLPEDKLYPKISRNVTDDRVFGSISTHNMEDFYDMAQVEQMRCEIEKEKGLRIVYGVGAGFVYPYGKLIYCDVTRWEIQLRYRSGLDNWGVGNYDEDILRKYKRGYFVEWRMQDRHKMAVFDRVLYWLDMVHPMDPRMIDHTLMDVSLNVFAASPFRLIPYFDVGVWGGRWMEEVCGLPHQNNQYAWCFDGVPEENAIGIRAGGIAYEMPAMNLVKKKAISLLGPKVYARFGAEFPIRFDFLDTMGGQNLSLQVHPDTEYIHDNFGMAYTQDESYYILDCEEDAHVYLGVKNDVYADMLIPALERAADGSERFDADRYINRFPVKKHDHILIPSGTIHCSGKNAMVLEISATPYIFTFKLWDWGRLGLDGKPRPINVERGRHVIRYERDTDWCQKNLISQIKVLQEDAHCRVERTGLHELEFVETRRYWFDRKIVVDCLDSVNMLNLVEGQEALVTSLHGEFKPLEVHYAETFIVPSSVSQYCIEPYGESWGRTIGVLQASVRV